MSVSDLRFSSVQALRGAARHASMTKFSREKDKRGYYITHYELDPIIRELFLEMQKAVINTANGNKKEEVVQDPSPGPVQRVREWTKSHPKATREQALAEFPDLNPATVRIQFTKVRKAG